MTQKYQHELGQQKDKNQNEATLKLLAKVQNQDSRIAAGIVLILILLTVYFGLINAFAILQAKPIPMKIRLFGQSDFHRDEPDFGLIMQWDGADTDTNTIRPMILVEGKEIPVVYQENEPRVLINHKTSQLLTFIVNSNTTPGLHTGKLKLIQINAKKNEPMILEPLQISISVSSGFWQTWIILRWWLIILFFLLIILYWFCVLYFPKPRGFVEIFPENEWNRNVRIPLHRTFKSIFFPWTRSKIGLHHIWKRYKKSGPRKKFGEICFLSTKLPVLFYWGPKRSGFGYGKAQSQELMPQEFRIDQFTACGRMEVMYSEKTFRAYANEVGQNIRFRWRYK